MRARFALGVALLSASLSSSSFATETKEQTALKLDREAIYKDYLATKFADAEKKLKQALAICASGACSAAVRGKLHVDLAIVYGEGLKRAGDAKAQFEAALADDPSQSIPSDLVTDELANLFEASKAPKAGSRPAAASDDLVHEPPAEQRILTPVPLYAEVGEGLHAAKVQVRYHPFGSSAWKTIDMKRASRGYVAEIPCLDVGTTTGDLAYYVQVVDTGGDVVALSGSRQTPNSVAIKNQLAGPPPHLPDREPAAACPNPADCPPGLPGCVARAKVKSEHGEKGAGVACADDRECEWGLACKVGACRATDERPPACETDADCDQGDACSTGTCVRRSGRNWVSLAVQQEVLLLGGVENACAPQSELACFADGSPYVAGQPYTPETGDRIGGGPAIATTRILVGFDRNVAENVSLGVRAGYAFGGAPARDGGPSFFPVHLEARAAYWFGSRPFLTSRFRPYVVIGAGRAQIDAHRAVTVRNQDPQPNGMPLPAQAREVTPDAWRKTGTTFAAAGVGAAYALSRATSGLAELKVHQMFGTPGTALSLQLGCSVGF